MTKKIDEQIAVHMQDGAPTRFHWRNQVFVVRQVVMYWIDVEPWWHHEFEHDVTWHVWRVEAQCSTQRVILDVAYRDSLLSGNAFPWRIVRMFD